MKKRKTNRAKRSVKSCKNHGDCCYCKGNRTYQARKEGVKWSSHDKEGEK